MSDLTHGFCLIDWEKLVRVFAALLTPVIACVTAYIAWQQHKTNKDQFRLALFERRIQTVQFHLGTSSQVSSGPGGLGLMTLEISVGNERKVGSCSAPMYLHTCTSLYEKASDVYALEGAVDEAPKAKRKAALLWLSDQGEEAKKKFGTYMTFSE